MTALKEAEEKGSKMASQAKELLNGKTGKEVGNLSDSYLENIYAQAYRLYNTGKYADAMHLFRVLVLMNAMEPKYIMGLAACYHMLKDYKNAIQMYVSCALFDPHNPIPHYHSSDCYIQMKDYLSAMVCLELTMKHAKDLPCYSMIKERAQLSLERLKKLVDAGRKQ